MNEDERLARREQVLLLLDAYGPLLSASQDKALTGYYRYDLSLGEIAESEGASRAAIADAIKKGEAKLCDIEEKLGHLQTKKRLLDLLDRIDHATPQEKESLLASLRKEIEHGI